MQDELADKRTNVQQSAQEDSQSSHHVLCVGYPFFELLHTLQCEYGHLYL